MAAFPFYRKGAELIHGKVAVHAAFELQAHLMLFFTGNSRSAWDILRQQRKATSDQEPLVVEALHEMKSLAVRTVEALKAEDLSRFGRLLHESWQFKKRLASGITNQTIDEAYDLARRHGALGGKITGAGGGGYLLVYCEPDAQPAVRRALRHKGLEQMHFAFEHEGARIVMNSGDNVPRRQGVRL